MSNFSKDHPSIRVFAPPGGRSTNIFGVPEPDQPISTKKNYMESDIFGCKKDNTDSGPVKQTRNVTNNIYGTEPEQSVSKSSTYSDKNKSSIFDDPPPQQQPSNKPDRQRSNIFGTNETMQSGAAAARQVSDKNKSNIFGIGNNDEQTKRQGGTRQGLRVGYNPINGEPYSTKDGLNSKVEDAENDKQSDDMAKTPEEENEEQGENGNAQPPENGNAQVPDENGNSHASVDKPANGHGNSQASVDKSANGHDNAANGNTNGKNPYTNVRVCHPPGGKSNGPLW